MDNPTFAERIATLKKMAKELQQCAERVLAEAQRMEAAQSRFAQRVGKRPGQQGRKNGA
jgi:ribosomal protein L17